MKKYYLFSLMFLCLFLVVIYCEERVEDGVHISYYENGQKRDELTYKDGTFDGLYSNWYENGQKMYENTYDDGKLISEKNGMKMVQ